MSVVLRLLAVIFYPLVTSHNSLKLTEDKAWDLDGPCQPYIKEFSDVSSKMLHCAIRYSSPPKVCTYCTDQFVAFRHIEYQLHKLKHVYSLDNTTCDRVIFDDYLISYVSEVSNLIMRNIWTQSRCSSCVIINWQFETNSTDYSYHNNTVEFQDKLYAWRRCVSNYSTYIHKNRTVICDECMNSFNALFQFYWHIYVTPEIDFCLDVETTMNDTMNLWHNVWKCPDDRVEEQRDWTLLGYSLALLAIITVLFYTGSYVQSEEIQRHLVQYSRLEAPSGIRSRLLSSSSLDVDIASTSTAQMNSVPIFTVQ